MGKSQESIQTNRFLVVDDHEAVLGGTVSSLQRQYPEIEILTAQTVETASQKLKTGDISLLVMDLSIPNLLGETARTENGIQLLRDALRCYPALSIVVQSAYTKALVRLKPLINAHQGGFTVVDKSLPLREMLTKVEWSLQGLIYTPREMRAGLEMKPEWIEVLKLAFEQGLQDKLIAEQINVAERTVRHYWTQVQDALGVYPEPGKNIRIQTEMRAREEGLID